MGLMSRPFHQSNPDTGGMCSFMIEALFSYSEVYGDSFQSRLSPISTFNFASCYAIPALLIRCLKLFGNFFAVSSFAA
jgi:hypothetical protein